MLKKGTIIIITVYILFMFMLYQLLMLGMLWTDALPRNLEGENQNFTSDGQILPTGTDYLIVDDNTESIVARNVAEWCALYKSGVQKLNALPDVKNEYSSVSTVFVTTSNIETVCPTETLKKVLQDGIEIIFCISPTISEGNAELLKLLGIRQYGAPYIQRGMDVLEGMLLGGMFRSEKISVNTRKIFIDGTAKVFACGYNKEIRNEENVPLIWRTYYGGTAVYVINSDLMLKKSGMGFLSGLISVALDTYIYPIVNAKVTVLNNYPMLTSEYDASFNRIYNRGVQNFTRDVIWSDLLSGLNSLELSFTCYATAGFNASTLGNYAINNDTLSFFSKEFYKHKCEFAVGNPFYDTPQDKTHVEMVVSALHNRLSKYTIHSALTKIPGDFSIPGISVTSVPGLFDAAEKSVSFSYINKTAVNLPVTVEGTEIDDKEILETRLMATAMGYISYGVDYGPVYTNDSGDDLYRRFNRDFGDSMYAIMFPFKNIEAQTATGAANRMRAFLNTDVEVSQNGRDIKIKTNNDGVSYLMLRSKYGVASMENVEIASLESRATILKVFGRNASITLSEGEAR